MKLHKYLLMIGILAALGVAFFTTGRSRPPGAEPDPVAAISLTIDVSDRQLYVIEDGEVIDEYPVAVGTAKHPTPRGAFRVQRVIWNPRWVPPEAEWAADERPKAPGDPDNPMGRVKVFFKEPDYYIHGTSAEGSIGRAASHGCVRMRNQDIIELAQLLMEHGDAPVEPGLIRRLINRVTQTREVRLAAAVPVRVRS